MKVYTIGTMTGTSMDGINVALLCLDVDETTQKINDFKRIAFLEKSYAYPFHFLLKAMEWCLNQAEGDEATACREMTIKTVEQFLLAKMGMTKEQCVSTLEDIKSYIKQNLSLQLPLYNSIIEHSTKLHAELINDLIGQANMCAEEVHCIGYHGQTLYHQPQLPNGQPGCTIQVGDGQLLADLTHCTVVNHFRDMDVANGGQGAPLAPLYHFALAKRDKRALPLAVINCGGISNITFVDGHEETSITALDAGPGNGLLDQFVKRKTQLQQTMDRDGNYGLQGQVNSALLALLFRESIQVNNENYFEMSGHKSLDINHMHLPEALMKCDLPEGCATLAAFTAEALARSIQAHYKETGHCPNELILAGGGWYNNKIYQELETRVNKAFPEQKIQLRRAHDHNVGWNGDSLEAETFGYLALLAIKGEPLTYPKITGAKSDGGLSGGHAFLPTNSEKTIPDYTLFLLGENRGILDGYPELRPTLQSVVFS